MLIARSEKHCFMTITLDRLVDTGSYLQNRGLSAAISSQSFRCSCTFFSKFCRPVHPPYSSVFVTEFNPEYGNADLLIWLRKRSSPKCGNAHGHVNILFTVIYCVKNVAPSVGNAPVPIYYA